MKKIIILILVLSYLSVFSQPSQLDYSFTENKGQIKDENGINHPEILFTGQGEDYSIYLRKKGWSYILKSYDSTSYQTQRVDIDFENSTPEFKVETNYKLPGYDNFPVRNNEEIQFVYSFSEVVYKEVYKGIDLRFYYDKGNLRYDFIVHPKADPNQILMTIKYSDNPTINPENGINIPTILGGIRKEKPFAYQVDSIQKIEITCNYKLADNKIWFNTGIYDNSKELIIDPVSLVWGKIRRLKSYFAGDFILMTMSDLNFYSLCLTYKNVKRLKDNSVILLSNNSEDKSFIESAYKTAKNINNNILNNYSIVIPTVISKYDSTGNKEWSVYLYEKQNNVISWDANDSLIIVYAHSFFYLDTISNVYNKEAVFVSVYDIRGSLLNRFELIIPKGIEKIVHPQMDAYKFTPTVINNYTWIDFMNDDWTFGISYENILQLRDNQISLLATGMYYGNNDSTYNYGLFHQTYQLDGKLQYNMELKHNRIFIKNEYIDFDNSSFDYSNLNRDIPIIRFLNDGSLFVIRNNIKNKELQIESKIKSEAYFEFYDKQGNLTSKSSEYNDFRFFLEDKFIGQGNDTAKSHCFGNQFSFNIDNNKNIFAVFHFDSSDIAVKKYKNLIISNPYTPNYQKRQPYMLKFDSTGKLLWMSQILSFPDLYSITTWAYIMIQGYTPTYELSYINEGKSTDKNAEAFYRSPMHTGTEIIMATDSVGNIYIPRIIDSLEYRVQSSSRKLVIIKLAPDGKILWQDTSALHFKFNYPDYSPLSSIMKIKNISLVGNSLYIEYFVSNLQGMTPGKDTDKYDLKGKYPLHDNNYFFGDDPDPYYTTDVTYDLLFLKFNINEKDLIDISYKDSLNDTTCVGSVKTYKININNKWHSKMIFDPPIVEGEGYSITPSGSFTLDTGKSKEFTILFSPTEFKTYNAKITFKQNNIGTFSNTINITGFTKATFLKSDSVWNLGTILINNTASGTFTLYNTGNIGSWFWGIKDLPSEFKQILPIDNSSFIKPYDSINFKLEFTPTKAGIFEYKYKFITTIGCPDTLEITIRGRGVTESIELSSDSLDYGYLYSCETKTDTLFIENVANNPVTYQSADLTGLNPDNFNIFQKPADGTIMLRGNPLKFIVQFKPSGFYGIKKAILKIYTSEKSLDCPLTGEYSEIKISANDIEMGYKSINVAYDLTIKITNNTKDKFTLEQAIPEDSRITVTTVLPLDVPAMDSKDLAIRIKSATKGPLNPKVKLIFSGRCAAELNSNINCKFDSASAEIASIDFGKVPYCENRIDSIAIKNTSKTLFKIADIQFSENDGRFEFTGNDTYPLEIQAGNTYKKGIRYLAGVKQVSNNQAKVLITMEMNGKEQTFEILIKGERVIPDLSYQNLINLGQSKPGEIKTNDIEITNNGEDINISDVKITDNKNYQVKDYPKFISKNTKGNINISFSSDNIGSYATDMTVYFKLGECIDSLKINLNAEVKRLMTIWANNDTTDAGTMGYYVPIYAKTDLGANINGSNYSLNVKYLPEIYNSITCEDASISATTRDGSYEIVKVEGKFPEFKDSTEILFHLKGNVLFSTIKTTPIEIEYLNSEKSLAVTTIAGSLTITPVCINKFRGIQYYKPASMSVTPHPLNESSKINIVSQNRGLHVLELYSVSGERYEIASWTQSNEEPQIHELTLEKKSFPSGVYLLNLRMEWSNVQEVVVVVE